MMGAAKKQRTIDYFERLAKEEIVELVKQNTAKLKEKQAEQKKLEEVEFNKENQDEHKVTNTG